MFNIAIYKKTLTVISATVLLFLSNSIQAQPLNLNLFHPDITSAFIMSNYDAGTGTFSAHGRALYISNAVDHDVWNGSFDLHADIDNNGNLIGGTLFIEGRIDDASNPMVTLIMGDLTNFGYQPEGGDPLEFLFNPTGGQLISEYNGMQGGVIMAGSGFGGSFEENFSGTYGASDTAPVPVPAAVWLLGTGILGLLTASRRKRTTA